MLGSNSLDTQADRIALENQSLEEVSFYEKKLEVSEFQRQTRKDGRALRTIFSHMKLVRPLV
jgi:hypothetical protein